MVTIFTFVISMLLLICLTNRNIFVRDTKRKHLRVSEEHPKTLPRKIIDNTTSIIGLFDNLPCLDFTLVVHKSFISNFSLEFVQGKTELEVKFT